jgi:hypothetical protein
MFQIEIMKLIRIFCWWQFFGYAAMLVYGFDAYLKYIAWKAGDIAQGDRVTKSATATSPRSPAY